MPGGKSQNLEKRKPVSVGNYRFTGKLLGKGNFARVEEAIHSILNVKVAVKIMDINSIKEEYVIKNLYREAKLMAKLNHPCIAALYQTMQRTDHIYFIVTEVASGGDLCAFIKSQRNGRLEERPTRTYARQFVSALAHMHNIGVVHRDLKMENVMLNAAQTQIKIVDFGLGNIYDPNNPLKTHCGSPEYAAPELFITGKRYGPEVDVWSFGIILYGMVLGELPFISRSEKVSSQEKRKKLIAQINKGLNNYHKRELQILSPEFRIMIYRMLCVDVPKRLTIWDLLVHPWITEHGKKVIKPNPMPPLDCTMQNKIISEICEVSRKAFNEVITSIKEEPMSKIGGMFNILSHRYALGKLGADPVTKRSTEMQSSSSKPPIPYNLRSLTRAASASVSNYVAQKNSLYTPRVSSVSQKRPTTEIKQSAASKLKPTRPSTVQAPSQEVDYRLLKSPTLRRKAYSAMITPKTAPVRPTKTSPIVNVPKTRQRTKVENEFAKQICIQTDDARKISEILGNGLRKLKEIKRTPVRAQTAHISDKKTKTTTERYSITRPLTTASSAIKRKMSKNTVDISHVNTTQSDSIKTNGPATITRPVTRSSRGKNAPAYTHNKQLDCSSLAFGDTSLQNQSSQHRKPIIYDPIARSIAGYVSHNVPTKFSKLSFLNRK